MKKTPLLFILAFWSLIGFSQELDKLIKLRPTGYVNDYENIFSLEEKIDLDTILSDYEKKTSIEFCLVTSSDFNFDSNDDIKLAESWGVGKEGLNNGLLIVLSQKQGMISIRTGYGLEPLLTDASLNRIKNNVSLKYNDKSYYEKIKALIIGCQDKIGYDGYDFLIQKQKAEKQRMKDQLNSIFSWILKFLIGLSVSSGVGYIIVLFYRKRKKFLKLKNEILNIVGDIEMIKTDLLYFPPHIQAIYNVYKPIYKTNDKIKRRYVKEKTLTDLNHIYSEMLTCRKLVTETDKTIKTVRHNIDLIRDSLNKDHLYCDNHLKSILKNVNLESTIKNTTKEYYSTLWLQKLTNLNLHIDNVLLKYYDDKNKINNIIEDNNKIENTINDLFEYNKVFIKNIERLSKVKIGNRIDGIQINNFDFDNKMIKLKQLITKSFNYLNDDDFDSAILSYNNYKQLVYEIKNVFDYSTLLINDYDRSEDYITNNENKIEKIISKIKKIINESGVSQTTKLSYNNIKSNILSYKDTIDTDVISSATTLEETINKLNSIHGRIEDDILEYRSRQRIYTSNSGSSSYNRPSYSSPSHNSGGGFGGFGGGSFGGGGVIGKF